MGWGQGYGLERERHRGADRHERGLCTARQLCLRKGEVRVQLTVRGGVRCGVRSGVRGEVRGEVKVGRGEVKVGVRVRVAPLVELGHC